MAVTFAGLPLAGSLFPTQVQPPELQTKDTKFAGVRGVSAIHLETGGRWIELPIWLHGGYGQGQMVQVLEQLDAAVGMVDTLSIDATSGMPRTFPDCRFHGFLKDPIGSLIYVGGNLSGETAGSTYFTPGLLRFYQLTVGSSAGGGGLYIIQ